MTSTIIVRAHPAAPSTAVQVKLTDPDKDSARDHIIEDGGEATFYIHGSQYLSIEEVAVQVHRKQFVGECSVEDLAPKLNSSTRLDNATAQTDAVGRRMIPPYEPAPGSVRAFTNDRPGDDRVTPYNNAK